MHPLLATRYQGCTVLQGTSDSETYTAKFEALRIREEQLCAREDKIAKREASIEASKAEITNSQLQLTGQFLQLHVINILSFGQHKSRRCHFWS
jgi:hypothetical protein